MDWFKKLSTNEQKLIIYGTILVTIAVVWVFIYQPLTKIIKQKSQQKIELQKQYQHMQSSKSLLKKQQTKLSTYQRDLNKPFIAWVDQLLVKKQLSQYVTRSEPKDNQTLILNFESIIFDDLIRWLEPLELNYGINISEADINVTDRSNGLCNARITLEENK
jgi:type II secretory pathway component PulM